MKTKMKPFLLVAIVTLAGCIQQAGVAGEGVVFVSLDVSPEQTESGALVFVSAIVQNQGEVIADNVFVQILGLPDTWGIDGISDETTPDERKQSIGKLLPADPARGLPEGQQGIVIWQLTAPTKQTLTVYDGVTRLTYDYNTTVEATVRGVTLNYFRQTGELGGIRTSSQTLGPLQVTIRVPSAILSPQSTNLPIQFEIQNTGGGRAFDGAADATPTDQALDRISVRTEGDLNCNPQTVQIIQGKGLLSCSVAITDIDTLKDVDARLILLYHYFFDKSFSVTVLPPLITG